MKASTVKQALERATGNLKCKSCNSKPKHHACRTCGALRLLDNQVVNFDDDRIFAELGQRHHQFIEAARMWDAAGNKFKPPPPPPQRPIEGGNYYWKCCNCKRVENVVVDGSIPCVQCPHEHMVCKCCEILGEDEFYIGHCGDPKTWTFLDNKTYASFRKQANMRGSEEYKQLLGRQKGTGKGRWRRETTPDFLRDLVSPQKRTSGSIPKDLSISPTKKRAGGQSKGSSRRKDQRNDMNYRPLAPRPAVALSYENPPWRVQNTSNIPETSQRGDIFMSYGSIPHANTLTGGDQNLRMHQPPSLSSQVQMGIQRAPAGGAPRSQPHRGRSETTGQTSSERTRTPTRGRDRTASATGERSRERSRTPAPRPRAPSQTRGKNSDNARNPGAPPHGARPSASSHGQPVRRSQSPSVALGSVTSRPPGGSTPTNTNQNWTLPTRSSKSRTPDGETGTKKKSPTPPTYQTLDKDKPQFINPRDLGKGAKGP